MNNYDTNLSDSHWGIIEKTLNHIGKHKYALRVMVDAILYSTKTGVQRQMLPKDFPKRQLVCYYFNKW
jgi:putative transposase